MWRPPDPWDRWASLHPAPPEANAEGVATSALPEDTAPSPAPVMSSTPTSRLLRPSLFALTLVLWAAPLRAAEDCPEGDLLLGKTPSFVRGVAEPARLVDGDGAPPGAPWNSVEAAELKGASARIEWDLGASVPLTAVDLQADSNDEYVLSVSEDGKSFTPLWLAPATKEPGLQRRIGSGLTSRARYLRLEPRGGDGYYSVSEVRAWCSPRRAGPHRWRRVAVWWRIVRRRSRAGYARASCSSASWG